MQRIGRKSLVVAAIMVVAAAASLTAVSTAPGSPSRTLAGGTYRVGWESSSFNPTLPWSAAFDPTVENDPGARGIYSNLLLRTLVGTNHVAGAAGNALVPDLATNLPRPTNGGKRYTFTLKRGVKFGPPVNREITSADVRYAIERFARPGNGAFYPSFRAIRGFDAVRAGNAKSISGIVTPNARTIVFNLTTPAGDFPARLTEPASAPLPPEIGRCFEGKPGAYGRHLVSSGPYMIEGSDAVKLGSCAALRLLRGISDTQLTLVRNPRYDANTDTQAARESKPDRFVFAIAGKAVDTAKKLEAGELEDAYFYSSPKVLAPAAARADKLSRLRLSSADALYYLAMNLTKPPFDDVHVRRAMSWILDRAALRDAFGGPMAGSIARHYLPDAMLGNKAKDGGPFASAGDHGNVARAKTEMAKSKYATKGGVCIAKACKSIHYATAQANSMSTYAPSQRIPPIVEANAAAIGLTFIPRSVDPYRPSNNTPWVIFTAEWLKYAPDPANYVDSLLEGNRITANLNFNFSLMGITPAQAKKLGIRGSIEKVPSVDSDIARCNALTGASRLDCYARLDRKLTTEVVPWIPFLWRNRITILGPQVATWELDQASGMTAYAHVAVKG